MKFRDYDVSKVLVVENDDRAGFEQLLESIMNENKVIDLQYSTRAEVRVKGRFKIRGITRVLKERKVIFSALILIGGK